MPHARDLGLLFRLNLTRPCCTNTALLQPRTLTLDPQNRQSNDLSLPSYVRRILTTVLGSRFGVKAEELRAGLILYWAGCGRRLWGNGFMPSRSLYELQPVTANQDSPRAAFVDGQAILQGAKPRRCSVFGAFYQLEPEACRFRVWHRNTRPRSP